MQEVSCERRWTSTEMKIPSLASGFGKLPLHPHQLSAFFQTQLRSMDVGATKKIVL